MPIKSTLTADEQKALIQKKGQAAGTIPAPEVETEAEAGPANTGGFLNPGNLGDNANVSTDEVTGQGFTSSLDDGPEITGLLGMERTAMLLEALGAYKLMLSGMRARAAADNFSSLNPDTSDRFRERLQSFANGIAKCDQLLSELEA